MVGKAVRRLFGRRAAGEVRRLLDGRCEAPPPGGGRGGSGEQRRTGRRGAAGETRRHRWAVGEVWRQRRAAGEASAGCGRSKAPPRRERQGTPAGRRAGEARHQRGHRGEAPPPGGRRCGWLQGEAPPPGGALEGDERRRRQASVNRPHPFLTRASTSVSLPRVPPRLRRVYNHSHLPPTRQSPHARAHTYSTHT